MPTIATARAGVVTAPSRILALRDLPRTVGGLRFSILPERHSRLRLVGQDLRGAIEVRQHLDSPFAVRGTVIVHRSHPDTALRYCDVVDGPCLPDASEQTFLTEFTGPIYDDDLDAVITAMTRLHDLVMSDS